MSAVCSSLGTLPGGEIIADEYAIVSSITSTLT
jgi:hypothetical protein